MGAHAEKFGTSIMFIKVVVLICFKLVLFLFLLYCFCYCFLLLFAMVLPLLSSVLITVISTITAAIINLNWTFPLQYPWKSVS